MRLRLFLLTSTVLVAAACGGAVIPVKPTLFIDRTKLGFGQEDNSGTYIGATGFDSILLRNDGEDTLTLSSVVVQGDDGKFSILGPDKTSLVYKATASVQVSFVPAAAKHYAGTLVIDSDATNTPSVTVTLSGCGVDPNHVDLSYCENSTNFDAHVVDPNAE